jgi:hypothetical protein
MPIRCPSGKIMGRPDICERKLEFYDIIIPVQLLLVIDLEGFLNHSGIMATPEEMLPPFPFTVAFNGGHVAADTVRLLSCFRYLRDSTAWGKPVKSIPSLAAYYMTPLAGPHPGGHGGIDYYRMRGVIRFKRPYDLPIPYMAYRAGYALIAECRVKIWIELKDRVEFIAVSKPKDKVFLLVFKGYVAV